MDSDRPLHNPLEPGFRIDRYELLYAAAEGGMGSVWVARVRGKHGFERLVAIKVILPRFAADPHFRSMFLDEARIASSISHPNAAQILDVGEQHGLLYLVMEWIEGDSLHRLMRLAYKEGGPLPLGVVLRVVADTCGGLHAAHELADESGRSYEVVHRDISPQNVLVSTAGAAKLIDFGVARARDRVAGETSESVVKGKVRYMAPEQAMGQKVDRRADLWSVGVMLYAAITTRLPYERDSDIAVLRDLISGVPPAPVPATVPGPVAEIIGRLLQRRRDDRYASALELQHALEGAMQGIGVACSSSQVGACVTRLARERIESRKQSLRIALQAVEERARTRALLERPMPTDVTAPRPEVTSAPLSHSARLTSPSTPMVVVGSATLLGVVAISAALLLAVTRHGRMRELAVTSAAAAACAHAPESSAPPALPPAASTPPPVEAAAASGTVPPAAAPASSAPHITVAVTAAEGAQATHKVPRTPPAAPPAPKPSAAGLLGGTINSRK